MPYFSLDLNNTVKLKVHAIKEFIEFPPCFDICWLQCHGSLQDYDVINGRPLWNVNKVRTCYVDTDNHLVYRLITLLLKEYFLFITRKSDLSVKLFITLRHRWLLGEAANSNSRCQLQVYPQGSVQECSFRTAIKNFTKKADFSFFN